MRNNSVIGCIISWCAADLCTRGGFHQRTKARTRTPCNSSHKKYTWTNWCSRHETAIRGTNLWCVKSWLTALRCRLPVLGVRRRPTGHGRCRARRTHADMERKPARKKCLPLLRAPSKRIGRWRGERRVAVRAVQGKASARKRRAEKVDSLASAKYSRAREEYSSATLNMPWAFLSLRYGLRPSVRALAQ